MILTPATVPGKAKIILIAHFHLSPDEIYEFMETLSDLGLLSLEGRAVKERLRVDTMRKTDSMSHQLQKGWDTFDDKTKKNLIDTRDEVANPKVKQFLESKITQGP